ncbi:hypothetical protein RJ639_001115 [Escallonia herrerae]|uniref:60S acidic ribosomal protein P1 n=1 Tax=Escallonia herrerae TaxID=1293975 RepID=A0AA89BN67_9ASTE|nr:hypothetical protein RJ639_001115 [Escallonia herrerae]
MSVGELGCTYASLILQDDGIPITAEKIAALLKAANVAAESYWPSLFAKLAEKRNIEDLITNVGAGGGGAAVAVAAPSAGGGGAAAPAAAAVEEKKNTGATHPLVAFYLSAKKQHPEQNTQFRTRIVEPSAHRTRPNTSIQQPSLPHSSFILKFVLTVKSPNLTNKSRSLLLQTIMLMSLFSSFDALSAETIGQKVGTYCFSRAPAVDTAEDKHAAVVEEDKKVGSGPPPGAVKKPQNGQGQ